MLIICELTAHKNYISETLTLMTNVLQAQNLVIMKKN